MVIAVSNHVYAGVNMECVHWEVNEKNIAFAAKSIKTTVTRTISKLKWVSQNAVWMGLD